MNIEMAHFSVYKSTNDRFIIPRALTGATLALAAYLVCGELGNDGLRVLCAVIGTAGWLYAGAAVISGQVAVASGRFVLAALAFVIALQALRQPAYLPLGFALHGLYALTYPVFARQMRREDATLFSIWGVFSAVMALLTAIALPG